jgi:transcriptional regulator with XRE-family HTH domain
MARLIRQARLRGGLSQRELAKMSGVPQSTVGRIETGRVLPRWSTAVKLLEASGSTLELASAAGSGIDRTQIRELLRLTPLERAELAAADAASLRRVTGDRTK